MTGRSAERAPPRSVRLGLKNGVQGCVKEGDDGEGPSKDGEEGGNIVVKVAALLLDDHRHGRDVVDELGLRDSRLVVCHYLVGGEHLIGEHLVSPRAAKLVTRRDNLEVVVESLVRFLHDKVEEVHGRPFGGQLHPATRDLVLLRLRQLVPEAQVVHRVRQVRHRRHDVVVVATSFDVEVARHSIDHDEPDEHAAGVVGVPVGGVRLARLGPLLVLPLELQLALAELEQRRHRAVRPVVGGVDGFAVLVEAHGGEGHHPLLLAECRLRHAVHLCDSDGQVLGLLDLLGELLPRGLEALAPNAPRRVEIHKYELSLHDELLPSCRDDRLRVHPILMELRQ
mmetsp:Transcript_24797/g.55848  ORF Transcript_24797/g.55848 Transcript_24797/m.55848 type:complete len:339 (+) Transcript_24797:160-1176(+)